MPRTKVKARQALMDSATVLLAQNPGASFVEIAEAAGVGRATLYRHFPAREDLLRALSLEAIAATDAVSARVLVTAGSASDALVELLAALVPLGDRYYFLMRIGELNDPVINTHLKRQDDDLAKMIVAAQKEGGIDPTVPTRWAVHVFNSLVYAAWVSAGEGSLSTNNLVTLAQKTLRDGLGIGKAKEDENE